MRSQRDFATIRLMSNWSSIEALYARAGAFFAGVELRLRQSGLPFHGFKLLNAPPIHRPDFLFVGYQPGGGAAAYAHEIGLGSHLRWPDEPEFVTAEWELAIRMQQTFPREVLMRSMGSNVVFLRWPSMRDYRRTVPADLREEVETFSRRTLAEIMDVVEPKRVVTIGFDALRAEITVPDLTSPTGRVLTRSGTLCDRAAIGMMHLTGCRISNVDRVAIRNRFARAVTG
jgi:hypothetical protein